MSIMAFEFPIMEMNFALSEFEFNVFTLEIDFIILTSGNQFSNLNFLLTFNGHSRPPTLRGLLSLFVASFHY